MRTQADLVIVELRQGAFSGRGEGVPIPRYGDSVASCIELLERVRPEIEAGADRKAVAALLPAGAARNALDCALWDLEANLAGLSVAALAGLSAAPSIVTAQTISLDTPQAMGQAAARFGDYPLLKIKVNDDDPVARVRAVRQAAPRARLVVDANEAWTMELLERVMPQLSDLAVSLVEQPLPAGADQDLEGHEWPAPLCADESCHIAEDVEALRGRYRAVNIKLDKTGGLTEALNLLKAARNAGLDIMCGCMICSSLSIAPAYLIASLADYADLDGPTWLAGDRTGGAVFRRGRVSAPSGELWGGPGGELRGAG